MCCFLFTAGSLNLGEKPLDVLVGTLVFWPHQRIELAAYPAGVREALKKFLERYETYRSPRPALPANAPGDEKMVWKAQVGYERRLAAVSAGAAAVAFGYVQALHPCYEWEGLHDCPEREASFAREYRLEHPGGPLNDYLPLLEAHRWLCTAEAYEYEKSPKSAERSSKEFRQAIAVALRSRSPLMRTAAEALAARGSCRASAAR
jgi:hypothetical protein